MTVSLSARLRLALPATVLLLAGACSDGTGPGSLSVPGSFASSVSMPGTGTAGGPAGASPTVELRDTQGRAMAGVGVTFEITAGGGRAERTTATTDGNGRASAGVWTLGTQAGANTLVARTGGLGPVTFQVTGVAGAPASLTAVTANPTTGTAGQALTPAPAVRVADQYANPVQGAVVGFGVTAGGGTVTGASALSGTDGVARVGSWTLGATGVNQLTASAPGLAAVVFVANASGGTPAHLAKAAGDNQAVSLGGTVPVRPTVRVTDAAGLPVGGATVTFAVASGGGSITGPSQVTNTDGLASVGSWTLGATEGTNTLTATVANVGSVTFTATAVSGLPTSQFHIDVRYVGTVSATYQQAFADAVGRWRSIIIGDVPSLFLSTTAGQCGNAPAVNETIDDLVIYVELKEIDGPGGVLGQAGPCFARDQSLIPVLGWMQFDTADLQRLQQQGMLAPTILHEIGHVLGIGTIWSYRSPSLLQGATTDDPWYSGAVGIQYFGAAGGIVVNGVPVENTGGDGTRDSHWRESILRTELMTGWIAPGANPLSAITIGSLADLGYTVSYLAADTYAVPPAGSLMAAREQGFELIEQPMPPPILVR